MLYMHKPICTKYPVTTKYPSTKVCKFDTRKWSSHLKYFDLFGKLDNILNDHTKFKELVVKHDEIYPTITEVNSVSYYI